MHHLWERRRLCVLWDHHAGRLKCWSKCLMLVWMWHASISHMVIIKLMDSQSKIWGTLYCKDLDWNALLCSIQRGLKSVQECSKTRLSPLKLVKNSRFWLTTLSKVTKLKLLAHISSYLKQSKLDLKFLLLTVRLHASSLKLEKTMSLLSARTHAQLERGKTWICQEPLLSCQLSQSKITKISLSSVWNGMSTLLPLHLSERHQMLSTSEKFLVQKAPTLRSCRRLRIKRDCKTMSKF